MAKFISIILSLVVLTLLVMAVLNAQFTWQTASSGYLYIKGMDDLANANYRSARNYFHGAIESPVTKKQALLQIGYSYAAEKDYQKALDYYWLAIELDPKDYTARLSIARTLWALGWPKDALENYRKLVHDYPEDKPLLLELADAYYTRQKQNPSTLNLALAQENYEKGLSAGQMTPLRPWLRYAELSQNAHQHDKAFELYCQILQHPNAPSEAIYSFALTLNDLQLHETAHHWMRIAAEEQSAINPERATVWVNQAMSIKAFSPKAPTGNEEERANTLSENQKACLNSLDAIDRFHMKKKPSTK